MKSPIALIFLVFSFTVISQSPEKMSYQAVIRDAGNNLIINQTVGTQISILQTSPTGNAVYIETQFPQSNENGLLSIEIGAGNVVFGAFNTIDWGNGPYFIKTETDPTGATNYTITGTSQLLSVPFALHSNTADSLVGGVNETDPIFGNSIAGAIVTADTAHWNNHTIDTQIDSSGIANLGYVAGGITSEVDGSLTNEIQTISRTGTTVTLTNGGSFQDSVNIYLAGNGIDISNNVVSISTSGTCGLSIGDSLQGGIIFYLDASGCHGLISATTDQSVGIQWFNTQGVTNTMAYSSCVGCGDGNTSLIVNNQGAGSYAAIICQELTLGGETDWYLPSKHELNLMYTNIGQGNVLGLGNVGGFLNVVYWSSTESDTTHQAWAHNFGNSTRFELSKPNTRYVRAIRAF